MKLVKPLSSGSKEDDDIGEDKEEFKEIYNYVHCRLRFVILYLLM